MKITYAQFRDMVEEAEPFADLDAVKFDYVKNIDTIEQLVAQWDIGYFAYFYFKNIGKHRRLCEHGIAQSAQYSYFYATKFLKKRFRLGEQAIAQSVHFSLHYAIDVLHGRFAAGEYRISKNAEASYFYALYALQGRFELGEPAIYSDEYFAQCYDNYLRDLAARAAYTGD